MDDSQCLFKSEQKKLKSILILCLNGFRSIGRAGTYRYEVDIDDCIMQSLEIGNLH